jgi:hypothetical protein
MNGYRQWVLEDVDFGDKFKEFLGLIGAKPEPELVVSRFSNRSRYYFAWKGNVNIVTSCDPLGSYSPSLPGRRLGYAGSLSLEGRADLVGKATDLIHDLATFKQEGMFGFYFYSQTRSRE